jgi:hypothetical protein
VDAIHNEPYKKNLVGTLHFGFWFISDFSSRVPLGSLRIVVDIIQLLGPNNFLIHPAREIYENPDQQN